MWNRSATEYGIVPENFSHQTGTFLVCDSEIVPRFAPMAPIGEDSRDEMMAVYMKFGSGIPDGHSPVCDWSLLHWHASIGAGLMS